MTTRGVTRTRALIVVSRPFGAVAALCPLHSSLISPNLSQMAYNAQSPLRGDSGANKRKRGLTRGKHGRTRRLLCV